MIVSEKHNLITQVEFYRSNTQLKERAWDVLEAHVIAADQAGQMLASILLDIDCFHTLFDELEPEAVQTILTQCQEHLQALALEKQASALSYGRDEFLFLQVVQGMEEAMFQTEQVRWQLTEKLRAAMPLVGLAKDGKVSCSAGLAVYPLHAHEAMALLGKAEEGLYLAKRQGRNQTRLPSRDSMVLKANYYSQVQLERLSALAKKLGQTEAALLREALNRLLSDYDI